jgi:hypothetical protein
LITSIQADFVWPKELYKISEKEWLPIALANTPADFNVEGLTNEEFIQRADAIYVDLRGDGHKQLIINNGGGGSAGRDWSIYDKANGKWILIGDGSGIITICAPMNGYNQIEMWGRGGGGTFTKELLCFQKGRYHLVRLEDWKVVDEFGNRQFVGSRDPKPYDN